MKVRYIVDINIDELDSETEIKLSNEIDDFISNNELICDNVSSVRVRVQDEYCIKEEHKLLKSARNAVISPVDVGDIVWYIRGGYYKSQLKEPQPIEVTEINKKWHGKTLEWGFIANGTRYRFSSIGKSVFLSEQDAIEFLERKAANK